jgi:transcriptional regulator with XRE-family HTH domain
MERVNEGFAERIKKLRESKGMGVRELAAELGISHSAISLYESCTTLFNISDGVIKVYYEYVNVDGTEYRAKVYRNFHHCFTYIT